MLFRRNKTHLTAAATTAVEAVRLAVVPRNDSFIGDDDREVFVDGFSIFDAGGAMYHPSERGPVDRGIWYSKVAGMPHHPEAQGRGCGPGRTVTLVPDPGNAYDPNAIKVVAGRRDLVGYIPKGLAVHLAPVLNGRTLSATVIKCYSVSGQRVGAEIVFSPDRPIRIEY